jgi:pimeloyl-ACP methyl ester carboxylesterase
VRAVLHDQFETAARLAESAVPVTVIYGDRDTIVPPGLSAQVADQARSLLERVVLRGADHDDEAMFGPQVADPVERLANAVG